MTEKLVSMYKAIHWFYFLKLYIGYLSQHNKHTVTLASVCYVFVGFSEN